MPKRIGPCTVLAIDPGTTTGLLVLSVDPRWLRGTGEPPGWVGLRNSVRFKAAYQVGREPRRFNIDTERATKIDAKEWDASVMPILAEGQPLMASGEFEGRGLRDRRFYSILKGDRASVGRGDLTTVDAGEVLQVRQTIGLLDNFPDAALVIENFVPRPTVSTDREVNSPDRLRLAIETEEMLHGIGRVPFLQMPSEAMNVANDVRLKAAGLYFAGMPHATDAARHAALFFRRCRTDADLRAQAFPRHFEGWDED